MTTLRLVTPLNYRCYINIFIYLSIYLLILCSTYCICISDIDECAVNNGNCSDYANCMNFQGSYSCTCMTGFTGDGSTCTGFLSIVNDRRTKLEMCDKSQRIAHLAPLCRPLENTNETLTNCPAPYLMYLKSFRK